MTRQHLVSAADAVDLGDVELAERWLQEELLQRACPVGVVEEQNVGEAANTQTRPAAVAGERFSPDEGVAGADALELSFDLRRYDP
jgi:hypothetical protein